MTPVNRWAEFRANFPDDQVEADGEILRVGGKGVAEAVAETLSGFRCQVAPPYDEGLSGWMCDFAYEGLALRFQVVDLGDHCLLIFDEPHRATRKYFRYGDALTKLNEALRLDGRFHDLTWYNYDGRRPRDNPSPTPVVGAQANPDAAGAQDGRSSDVSRDPGTETKRSLLDKLLAPLRARPESL